MDEPLTSVSSFRKLLPSFQGQITRIQQDGWQNCFRLGVLLYQYADALWQVYGKRRKCERQHVHLDFARQVMDLGMDRVRQDESIEVIDYSCAIDTFSAWKAVIEASSMRLHPEEYDDSAARKPITRLTDIHSRCSKRAVLHAEHQHAACVTAALGFRLACGDVLGFLTPCDKESAAYFLGAALSSFKLEFDSPDHQTAYRSLMLDAALHAFADGDTVMQLLYCNKALESAEANSDIDDLTRARLIERFGRQGNRLAYRIFLWRNWRR